MFVYSPRAGAPARPHALPANAYLHVRDVLPETQSRVVVAWLQDRPNATLRLESRAFASLLRFGAAAPRHLVLGAGPPPSRLHELHRVECVTFSTGEGVARWLQLLPNARVVRIALRGESFDAAEVAEARLAGCSIVEGSIVNLRALEAVGLRALELRDVAVDRFEDVGNLTELRALRASAVERVRSLTGLRGLERLRSVWLQRLPYLERLSDLMSLPALESLELAGLWQFGIFDANVLYALPHLARASIDIGGRRKNVEILKRLQLPPALPFCLERELPAATCAAETATT